MDRVCPVCSKPLTSKNPRAKYCSSGCRARKSEGRVVQLHADQTAESTSDPGTVHSATLEELEAADRAGTALGQAALALARRIDTGIDTGSSMASAVKTLAETLAAATKGARRAETDLDRVRKARDAKRGA